MDFEQKDYELIASYLRDELTPAEKKTFEERMNTNPVFNKEVQLHVGVTNTIREKGWVAVDHQSNKKEITRLKNIRRSEKMLTHQNRIAAIADSYFKEQESGLKSPSSWKKYAASLSAAVVLGILMLRLFWSNPSASELYTDYVNWDGNLLSKIEQSETDKDQSQLGEAFFKKGDFEQARAIFMTELTNQKTPSSHTLMYLGASQLELGAYQKALATFDQLLALDTLDSSRALWYKAMVFLKKEDIPKAKEQLQLITIDPNNYNYQSAIALLDKL